MFGFLSSVLGIYSLLLVARIILTWFGGSQGSGIMRFLSRITDPYIDWWRQRFNLRLGFLDLSPIVAISALSVLQNIFSTIAARGTISLGIVVGVVISAVWSIISFLLTACIVILIIRLVGFLMNREMYGPFWQTVDAIARPIIFHASRLVFRGRAVNFVPSVIAGIALVAVIWILLRLVLVLLFRLLGVL